jgi:hypothetical protein
MKSTFLVTSSIFLQERNLQRLAFARTSVAVGMLGCNTFAKKE